MAEQPVSFILSCFNTVTVSEKMATDGRLTRSKQYLSDINIACVPCRSRIKRGKTNRGVKYCMDCQEFLCTVCVNKHNSVSVFAGHSLLDRSKFRTLGGSKDEHTASLRTKRHNLHLTKVLDGDQRYVKVPIIVY
jgi:hypothetical protein